MSIHQLDEHLTGISPRSNRLNKPFLESSSIISGGVACMAIPERVQIINTIHMID